MKYCLRLLFLYPLSLIFGAISRLRNFLFDKEIFKSTSFSVPIICVGNLAVGGTGKTPHTEYILSLFASLGKIAMLSRGYKRSTKGFLLAEHNSSASLIGDEPFQIHLKFPDVIVAVSEKRVKGVNELLKIEPNLELVVLDDAYQHRQIKAGLYILLSDYSKLYSNDSLLPFGRLRESKQGSRRADLIIVSKCPEALSESEMMSIKSELNTLKEQEIFFSTYQYEELIPVFPSAQKIVAESKLESDLSILLVAGIVSPQKIVEYLLKSVKHVETMFYADHHQFSKKDFASLRNKFVSLKTEKKMIVLTEKDAARILYDLNYPDDLKEYTFALPISVKILADKEDLLIQKIENYVKQNSRDSSIS